MRHQRIRAIFAKARATAPAQRPALIDAMCQGDETLKRKVLALLDADSASGNDFMPVAADKLIGPGTMLGRYRIDKEVGKGGMGMVFRAYVQDLEYSKCVAVKVVKPDKLQADSLARFDRERAILSKIDHPNIAKFVDLGTAPNGCPYFVMEFVDGMPLDEYCRANHLSIQRRLDLFQEVCLAVHHLHTIGVLHRDLTPRNILVTSWGKIKLVDFGIAKPIRQDAHSEEFTIGVGWIMTPDYASPEQKSLNDVLTPRSDIYSLGVVLYELLTGVLPKFTYLRLPFLRVVLPFGFVDASLAVSVKMAGLPMTPAQAKRLLRHKINPILALALRQSPQDRYRTAELMRIDLGRVLRGLPTLAGDQLANPLMRALRRLREMFSHHKHKRRETR